MHGPCSNRPENIDTVSVLFGFVFQQQKMRKLDVLGSVAGGHTMHVPGMSVAGLCATFAPPIKWHRIAL